MDGVSDVAGESIVHCTHFGREGAQAVKKTLDILLFAQYDINAEEAYDRRGVFARQYRPKGPSGDFAMAGPYLALAPGVLRVTLPLPLASCILHPHSHTREVSP